MYLKFLRRHRYVYLIVCNNLRGFCTSLYPGRGLGFCDEVAYTVEPAASCDEFSMVGPTECDCSHDNHKNMNSIVDSAP